MIEPFDPARMTVKPLDRAAAEATGHILWVEESSGPKALERMHAALLKAPFNCAVWANAGDLIPEQSRQALRDWRAEGSAEIANNLLSSATYPGGVKTLFAAAAEGQPASPGYAWLEDHVRATGADIFRGIATRFIHLKLRASEGRTTLKGYLDAHADGPSRWPHIRVLQSLECAGTYVLDNRDAVLRAVTEEDARNLSGYLGEPLEKSMEQVGRQEWMTRREGPITLWQPPANSVIMISDQSHHCQPILHSSPVTLPGQPPEKRTLAVYDCRLL